jgi:hypothetical protein
VISDLLRPAPRLAQGNGVLEAGEAATTAAVRRANGCNAMCLIENSLPCNANPQRLDRERVVRGRRL